MTVNRARLPWKRGPRAWEVACRAYEILVELEHSPRSFLSLRKAAAMLGLSTQPLRDWIRLGYLHRDGPRKQISINELTRIVIDLASRAKPFDPERYLDRIYIPRPELEDTFGKLWSSKFIWPKGRTALSPSELACLTGCHPTLIRLAIRREHVHGRRRTPERWEITRRAWSNAFPFSLT